MNIDEEREKRHLVEELTLEHRTLDELISQANDNPMYVDHLKLRRLKKRKLHLKDIIERLRSSLIPDLDA